MMFSQQAVEITLTAAAAAYSCTVVVLVMIASVTRRPASVLFNKTYICTTDG